MTRYLLMLFVGILLLLIAAPAAATQVLTTVSCMPNPPLMPGNQEHVVAKYTVIPSGSTTFPKGHELQMQTDLTDAKWTIQVTVDGNDAATQTASGIAAFVNGEILSYPTNHDVGLVVTIDGTVPQTPSDQLMVLQVEEIDNAGTVVPGSVIPVSEPVAVSAPGPGTAATPAPTLTPPPVAPTAAATRSPGFPTLLGIAAATIAGLAWTRRGK